MHNDSNRRRIRDLRPGESAYIADHMAWIHGDHMYVLADGFLGPLAPLGSNNLRLVRFPDNRLAVDVSAVTGNLHRGPCPFGSAGNSAIRVDVEIVKPAPDGTLRLNDVERGNHCWISTDDAWIWGDHMWVDGKAETSREMTAEKPLRIRRMLSGEYCCDISRCGQTHWRGNPQTMENWPLQISRML